MSNPQPCCEEEKKECWYQNKLLVISLVAALLYAGGFVFPVLKTFQKNLIDYLKMIWWALVLGFLLAGLIERYVPSKYISKVLASPRKRTIFYATGLGFVMSACSHGILAIAMQLYKKGASGPAVISFLLGSPWANLPVTILLVGLFREKGILIIASALLISLTTGLFFRVLSRLGWIDKNPNTLSVTDHFSIRGDLSRRWQESRWTGQKIVADAGQVIQGAKELADNILWWILLGVVLASLIGATVPSSFFSHYMGPTFTGLLLTLAAATLIEVCSEGSAPLAFEVYRQTGSIGNTFAFLMGGFVTDYTEVGLIWKNIGWRTAVWMVVTTVPQVLLLGWIYNQF